MKQTGRWMDKLTEKEIFNANDLSLCRRLDQTYMKTVSLPHQFLRALKHVTVMSLILLVNH